MKGMLMVSIYDQVAQAYMKPWFAANVADAVRSFKMAVNDPQTTLAKNPEDYVLYEVGFFDDSNGEVVPSFTKVVNATAVVDPTLVMENNTNENA